MTREEAIEILQEQRRRYCEDNYLALDYKIVVKAFDMAIEALKLIPDNATNGDVIKALFPNEGDFETDFDTDWWNAPYRKE